MRFYLVDVKEITSDVPRSNFDEAELETIAELIIESGGLIKPLVLKQSGAESYKVVEGDLEYYSAVRAKEKNPRQCEMVNAFVISPKIENLVLKQAEFFKGVDTSVISVKPPYKETDISELLDQKLKPIYAKVNQLIFPNPNPINIEKGDNEKQLKSIESKIENLSSIVEKLAKDIEKLIPPPPPLKLNLLTAKNEQIMIELSRVGANANQIKVALAAIKYWQETDKTLTWDNLLISTKTGKHKIPGFGDITYQKLKQIAEIHIE